MTFLKRLQDLVCVAIIGSVMLPVGLVIAALIALIDGRPVLFVSERMRSPDQSFKLLKFRTMINEADDAGVSGGDKLSRITPLGAKLRRLRLDEVPQLWNVLKGDISFVGPRPPLRVYVEDFPELYAKVLRSRPGITGVASIYFHAHEERLLAACTTPEETDAVYRRRCVARKATLDLIYQRKRTVCYDIWLMFKTIL